MILARFTLKNTQFLQLYYSPSLSDTSPLILTEEESRHAIQVLRHKVGDKLHLINGKGKRVVAEIISANPKKAVLNYIESVDHNQKQNLLHIAISPTKSNDRIEWFIEKACEIGIGQITPLICQRTERSKINLERWNKIVISACKQAQILYFPIINEATKLSKFIEKKSESSDLYIASIGATSMLSSIDKSKETIILIGPEGDFSEEEFGLIRQNKINEISLSENILRVETAGLVAVSQYAILD